MKQPYWIVALIGGIAFIGLPCVTIDKDNLWITHPPSSILLVSVGMILLLFSVLAFGSTLLPKKEAGATGGLDLTRVKEVDGTLSTCVGNCEINVVEGRIEDYTVKTGTAIVLPCNEYFDDRCAADTRSALGAYVNRVFEGQAKELIALIKDECKRKLGNGIQQQKTDDELAESYGAGECVLLMQPLGRSIPIALVSTTTQRAGQGLAGRISYLFDGMHELIVRLADARINEAAMPVLGSGHGGIDPPLAFIGLLLAIAEAARYGQGGQRLKKVTIVVFKSDKEGSPEVDRVVVRRGLALIGSRE
ncbi:MAG: macro domain-containing protein [Candidatus Korobacteraceae bacterium]